MGYNLYSYCKNLPVGKADYNGHFAITLTVAATVTLTVTDIVVIVGGTAIIATAVDYCMDPTDIRNPIRKAEVLIENQIAEAKENKSGEKLAQNGTNNVTQGKSRAPKTGTPGSTYEQVDSNGNIMSRTKYGKNGKPEHRDDFSGRAHYDKKTGQYLQQHRHCFKYNDNGQPIGEEIFPIPKLK